MRDFEMTQEQLDKIIAASWPVTLIMLQCGTPRSQQERANSAWQSLGKEMGFKHMTVEPNGKGNRYFRAEAT